MRTQSLLPWFAVSCALTLLVGACSTKGGDSTGAAGDNAPAGTNGAAGSGAAGVGAAGTSAAGTNGAAGTSAAGTNGAAGVAGVSGAAGVGIQGQAGTTGAAGMSAAGTSGTAGTSGAAGAGPGGMSGGCNMPPPSADSQTKWVKHDISVSGVDAAFITAHPPNAGGTYDWTHRNYFMRLPTGYDQSMPYPVVIGGSGCGGPDVVGQEGGYSILGTAPGETQAIQVALSYVPSSAVNACAGFADDFTNSPEPAYIRATIADLETKYCIDESKIFLSGYSSGAWEATLSGCTNSDELRGYGVQIGGGLRLHRPACTARPVAAIYIVGQSDTSNPIGPLTTPNDDSYGSAPSRDDILTRNGCTDKTTTAMWDTTYPQCVKYTGCPAAYPVVWCALAGVGHNPDPNDATVNLYRYNAIWKFYSTLPSP